jgi:hypothetical protein
VREKRSPMFTKFVDWAMTPSVPRWVATVVAALFAPIGDLDEAVR